MAERNRSIRFLASNHRFSTDFVHDAPARTPALTCPQGAPAVSRGNCGVDLRSRVCSRPRPGPHSHLLKRHALSPYPTSFLSPFPIPSLSDVPPRRFPASFVRQYRVGHLPAEIHAAPLSFLRHHPCPCRRRAVGLIAYGNDRGHRAPGFLFALLEHRTAVLVHSMGGCYLRDSALAVRLLFFCWVPVCLREPGVRVWQRALRSLSVRFSNMMRPPALDMYLSSSGLVPALPSLPPQCALSPGLYKMFECMPYVAKVARSECRWSRQLPHQRPVGRYRHVLAAGGIPETREQPLRSTEDQGVRWCPRGRW